MIDDEAILGFLEHHGIKGMRWGIRNDKPSSDRRSRKLSNGKKAAIVLGSAAAVGAIALGAVYAKKHLGVKVSDIPKPTETVTKFAKALSNEPVGIAHASRGFDRGYAFLRDGGMKNLDKEFSDAGLAEAAAGYFHRFGQNSEKVAARFADPLGRKDFAGRPIGHDVILPKSMAKDVHNANDVEKLVWPLIKDIFGAFYQSEKDTLGPGF